MNAKAVPEIETHEWISRHHVAPYKKQWPWGASASLKSRILEESGRDVNGGEEAGKISSEILDVDTGRESMSSKADMCHCESGGSKSQFARDGQKPTSHDVDYVPAEGLEGKVAAPGEGRYQVYAIAYKGIESSEETLVQDVLNFAMLTPTAIHPDVVAMPTMLYLRHGVQVQAHIHYRGGIDLSPGEQMAAQTYNTWLVRWTMHRWHCNSRQKPSAGGLQATPATLASNALVNQAEQNLGGVSDYGTCPEDRWPLLGSYLFLPLQTPSETSQAASCPPTEAGEGHLLAIDWAAIESINADNELEYLHSASQHKPIPPPSLDSAPGYGSPKRVKGGQGGNPRQPPLGLNPVAVLARTELVLSNGRFNQAEICHAVVTSVHLLTDYYVESISDDLTGLSPFPNTKKKGPAFVNFAEYYKVKYGLKLTFPEQPLLLVKQVPRVMNLLHQRPATEINTPFTSSNCKSSEQAMLALPPELCTYRHGMGFGVLQGALRLPSVMHRLEALMRAAEIRSRIGWPGHVPLRWILEALTSKSTMEGFCYERWEMLGDSVLKYAVARHLFFSLSATANENGLSSRLQDEVGNKRLYELACGRGLPAFISAQAFEPLLWPSPQEKASHKGPESVPPGRCQMIASKVIADVAEALLGVYSEEGEAATLHFLSWLGTDVRGARCCSEIGAETRQLADLSGKHLGEAELLLGYKFRDRWLLAQALLHPTHPQSLRQVASLWSFERLMFLGNAALDYVITRHLLRLHKDLEPGQLTAIKHALVNRECFARAAVRCGVHVHLQLSSPQCSSHISAFVAAQEKETPLTARPLAVTQKEEKTPAERPLSAEGEPRARREGSAAGFGGCGFRVAETSDLLAPHSYGQVEESAPWALTCQFQALAAAVLADAAFDLDKLWQVYEPLLQPLPEPATVQPHPTTSLLQLCQKRQWNVKVLSRRAPTSDFHLAEVVLNGRIIARQLNRNEQTARRLATSAALRNLADDGTPLIEVTPVKMTETAGV